MSDATFKLQAKPDLKGAERLTERLERVIGVTSAVVDPAERRILVTFDSDRTGDIALSQIIESEGFMVASEDETLSFTTDTPGYTDVARNEIAEQQAATNLTRDAEIPWYNR